jgi:hypothetical protein
MSVPVRKARAAPSTRPAPGCGQWPPRNPSTCNRRCLILLEKDTLYWQQRLANDAWLIRHHWFMRHFLAGTLKSQLERERLRQSRQAEEKVAQFIRDEFGYQVHSTTANCPFDLWVAGGPDRAARVEVKLATLHDNKGRNRFQADVRQSADVDLLIWLCRNGRDWHYIIPIADLRGRRNLAIWSACPGNYRGQWSHYLEAWDYLRQVVENTHQRVWQFGLPLAQGGAA